MAGANTADAHGDHAAAPEGLPAVVAIVGAGVMGNGIAYVSAVAGATTRLIDLDPAQIDSALEQIDRSLATGVTRNKITQDDADAARARIETFTDTAAACQGAELVIEAVTERMDVKHKVLPQLEQVVDDDTVIATNTSALSITEVISCLDDPSRGVGMHFFNPVPKMRLCEVIQGLQTSDETMDRAAAAAAAFGKQVVRIEDSPGFATSRVNALIGNEGMRMLEEGMATAETIDTAVKVGLNHPMGPLEMGDLVGWDTRLEILEYLASTLGERFRPTNLHRRMVAAGRLGRKTGRGIYRYDGPGGERIVDDPLD